MQEMDEGIDFVIAWVDGNDPQWRAEKRSFDPSSDKSDDSDVRYRDWNNLQYWFRAVEKYAPWVRKIHFVTWGHVPQWLNTAHPKLNIVRHTDYIPEDYLPTFNSHTIELNFHRIEDLSERFVYFNDDMFLTNHVEPEDFFRKGLPCDTFAFNAIYFAKNGIGHINGNNIEVINDHFGKKKVVARHWKKIFSYKYGFRLLFKTICLMPWPWFAGIYYQHLPGMYLKSTFEKVWEAEWERLDATCKCKFRDISNVNQWVMKYWQLVTGMFCPVSENTGKCFHVRKDNLNALCVAIREKEYNIICINDTERIDDIDFFINKVNNEFETALPFFSEFENCEIG